MAISSKKCLILITGASRGLGKSIALALAPKVRPDSSFVLLARNSEKLEETSRSLKNLSQSFVTHTFSVNNETADEEDFDSVFKKASLDTYDVALIVHNAGSLGKPGQRTTDLCSKAELRAYYDVNMVSVALLNAIFMKKLRPLTKKIVVVNISSLMALQPQASWSLYCSGKAARDLFFKTLAVEETGGNVRVLNYAPGPLDTDMLTEVLTDPRTLPTLKDRVEGMREAKQLLDPDDSAKKLVDILEKDEFQSGEHLDYYDV